MLLILIFGMCFLNDDNIVVDCAVYVIQTIDTYLIHVCLCIVWVYHNFAKRIVAIGTNGMIFAFENIAFVIF